MCLTGWPQQIISSKPKAGRRGGRARSSLGTSGRNEALGKRSAAPAAPAAKTRAAAAVQAKAATAVAAPTAADKIIVSNLPIDVTQEQIKVSIFQSLLTIAWTVADISDRICSPRLLDLSATLPSTTTPTASPRALPLSSSPAVETPTRPTSNITAGSSMAVSIPLYSSSPPSFLRLPRLSRMHPWSGCASTFSELQWIRGSLSLSSRPSTLWKWSCCCWSRMGLRAHG